MGSVAVSPRGDLRMPSDACATVWLRELFIEVQAILATLLAGKTDSPYIKVFQTDHVHIKASENTAWTWDGEYGGTMRETDQ